MCARAVAANPTANVSDAKLLDMLLRCMEAVAKEPADPKALKGALTPSAFTQVGAHRPTAPPHRPTCKLLPTSQCVPGWPALNRTCWRWHALVALQTCVECGVVGSLAAPASAADLHNLATAVQLASDVQAGLKQDMACVAFQVTSGGAHTRQGGEGRNKWHGWPPGTRFGLLFSPASRPALLL